MTTDLHQTFRDPARGAADAMERFLDDVDRMPGIRAIQRAMRGALDLRPGMRLVDAGCGTGLEAARLAADHPAVAVMGVDRNAELLDTARRRAGTGPENLAWVQADLAGPGLAPGCCDALRLERVLLHVPDEELDRALDAIVAMVRPGGRLALFDLDYGGTILPELGHGPSVVEDALEALARSAAQPSIGGRLPALLAERGVAEVRAAPYAFAVSAPVWRRIVRDTLLAGGRAARRRFGPWLDAHAGSAFLGAFTGVLATGRAAGR